MKKILLLILCLFSFGVVANDADDIVKFFKQNCDLNSAGSCLLLGYVYANGEDVKQDYFKANEYYKKACDLDNAHGCFNLGVAFVKGEGVKQDYLQATKYFKKACDLGLQIGCDLYKKLN